MTTTPHDPDTLPQRLQAGAPDAWTEFDAQYRKLARGAARKAGLSSADQDDVAQTAILRVYRGIGKFDPSRGEFRKWFGQVVRSAILNHYRAAGRRLTTNLDHGTELDGRAAPDNPLDALTKDAADRSAYTVEVLTEALEDVGRELEPRNYDAFYRQWHNDESAEAVAAALGISVAHAYVLKSRGLALLRAAVAQ